MRVKICGLTDPSHVEATAALGMEFIGLVFAERSRRHITVEQAKRMLMPLPEREAPEPTLELGGGGLWFQRCAAALDGLIAGRRPLIVGVFADQPPALMNSIAEMVGLDLIQLSGNERWETCLQLRRPVIKTVRTEPGLAGAAVRQRIETGMAHLLHIDAYVEGELGGTGQPAAWDVAGELARELPVMLAGGLTPANVGEAVAVVRPWAVDVSSGVERDGVKDVGLIGDFVRAARAAAVGTGAHGS